MNIDIVATTGNDDIARLYIARTASGHYIEFVESLQPPLTREQKWVVIVSSLIGCPIGCVFCDAGLRYGGKLPASALLAQIDYLVDRRYPDRVVPAEKFKIQFARMGEPALNPAVLEVLLLLQSRYDAPGLLPTLSTIAPEGSDSFFEELHRIVDQCYPEFFQLQFSIHSTDERVRDRIIPVRKWDLSRISDYGSSFYQPGGRKITLNFALAHETPFDPKIIDRYFDPEFFLLKFTPINPTFQARNNGIRSAIHPEIKIYEKLETLKSMGYDVILSIGELEENLIGSNCGQHLTNYLDQKERLENGYTYPVVKTSQGSAI